MRTIHSTSMKIMGFVLSGILTATNAFGAAPSDIVRSDMTQKELLNLKTQLQMVQKKSCANEGLGTKISKGAKYVGSAVVDTFPLAPLAWTGIQTLRGKKERVEEKKQAAGSTARLYTNEFFGGAVMTLATLGSIVFEAMVAYGQTHDQVYVSGTSYDFSSGKSVDTSGYISVPNGKEYQPTGAVEGVFGWLAASYSNTRTMSQAIARDKAIKMEVCRQSTETLSLVEERLPRTPSVARPASVVGPSSSMR